MGRPEAREIIESGYRLAINDIVCSKVAFSLLRLFYGSAYGEYKFYDMKRRVEQRDERLMRAYSIVGDFLRELERENRLVFLLVTVEVVREAGAIAREYGLLPNDALIAGTCRHYGVSTIATFDDNFKRIPWLKVIP